MVQIYIPTIKKVHISTIRQGDTIFHNEAWRTVSGTDIKYSQFMGVTLFGDSYKLGYKDEVIEQINIFGWEYKMFELDKPFVLMIKRNYELNNTIDNDDAFNTQRGMITKKFKRHLSLQNLDLKPNQLLWDIGAGSGACGIEAYKRYKVKTILFET